jgi:hypothetical protein
MIARFWAFAAVYQTSLLFWDVVGCLLVVYYVTTCQPKYWEHPKRAKI